MLSNPKILSELGFPQAGEILSGHEVKSTDYKFTKGQLKYQIKFPKEVKRADVPNILRMFFSKQLLNLEDGDYVVQAHDYSIKVGLKNTVVTGTVSVIPVSKANPAKVELTPMQDFDQEYSKMEIEKPESFFRKHTYGGFNTAQFRNKLFGFVSMMGENYGYCDKDHLYHRRASLIMPQIKITKAIPNAKMFYHTHPKKDEPSLSSPEDYLLYFDLSHEPRNIRHCFTVMKDRIDYFQVTPKKNKKSEYVKIDEDKIIAEIDAKMDEIQSKLDETMPSETMADNLAFCEKVTRETVKWLNKKYKTYFKIKYKCYYRVKKNPDDTDATSLHLDNEFLMKAINDIKAGEYTWPKFGSKELPHEQYAYWNAQYYFMVPTAVRTAHLGLQPGDFRRLDHFLNQEIEGTKFTYYDVLNILTVSHDVNKQDESNRDGGGYVTRMPELLDYLGIEGDLNENIIEVEKILHEDPYSDAAKGFGEYIVPVLLAHYSIQATSMMQRAREEKLDLDSVKYDLFYPFKKKVMGHLSTSMGELNQTLRDTNTPVPVWQIKVKKDEDRIYDVPADDYGIIEMVTHGINPPPEIEKTEFSSKVPTDIFNDGEFLKGVLSEFDPRKHGFDTDLHGSTGWTLKYPTDDNLVSFRMFSTGTVNLWASGEGNHEQAALNAYGKLIDVLTINGLMDKKDPIAQGLDKAVFDNPPMTGEQVIDAIDQENFFGGGAFGFVFKIPGTRYLLKIENDWPIDKKIDTKYFTALTKYLYSHFPDEIQKPYHAQGKWSKKPIPKPDYPFKGTLKKMNFGIENTRAGQPLYLVDDRYFIIDKIAGHPVGNKVPYIAKSNKNYTKKSMKDYYDHIEEMANLPQESWDELVGDIKLLTSKGLQHDVHSDNIIYNKSKKKLFLIDWWWGTKQSRHTAPSNVQPPFVQLVERTTMMFWISQMVNFFVDVAAYPDDEGTKKYKKELDYFYKREPKANEHRLTVYGKVDKAFRNNNFPRNKSNIVDSGLLPLMKEGEKYPDLFKRYLSLPLTTPRPPTGRARGGAGPLADPKTWPPLGSPYYMENPPPFEFSKDKAKRKKRWEFITTSAPHEIYEKAAEMAAEKDAYFEVQEQRLSRPVMKNIPANIEKDFLEWYYTHTKKLMFHLSVKGKQVASLERTVYQKPMPKSIHEFVKNYKTKHRNWEKGPLIRGFLSYRIHSGEVNLQHVTYPNFEWFGPNSPPKTAYPFMIDSGGGYVKKGKRFQGYYAILKMLEAAYMETNGIEGYGTGASLQRAEYFRSFGWLMPQDMKYAPYVHKGPRIYLDLVDDKAGWDSSPEILWRPVYSKTKKNPSAPKIIIVSGPSGSGKSTISKMIAKQTGGTLVPTVTTRSKRPNEKTGDDRIFVTEAEFKEMIAADEFIEYKQHKDGVYYGRRKSDMTDVSIVEVNLKGMMDYKQKFPDAFAVFLIPDKTPKQIEQRLMKRGGMSEENAKARAGIIPKQIAQAKLLPYDAYVTSRTGKYEEVAKEIVGKIPLKNPITVTYPYLYHVTPTENIEAIGTQGLLVEHAGDNFSLGSEEPAIWCVKTEWQGLNMLLRRTEKRGHHSLLKIDPSFLENEDVGAEPWEYEKWPDENIRLYENLMGRGGIMIKRDIPPEYITLVTPERIQEMIDRDARSREREELARIGTKGNPSWRHGEALDSENDPFSDMFEVKT